MSSYLYYALGEDSLREFLKIKDELSEMKAGMKPDEIKAGISEIYANASIFGLDENGNPDGVDLYVLDNEGNAHIPILGMLVPSINPCAALFGEAETEYRFIQKAIQEAEADPAVKAVVFEINSPGGYVEGVDVTGRMISSMKKPTESRVTGIAASGAYWLASQADKITATAPTDWFGSIGVVVEEIDFTERDKSRGITRRVHTSTKAPDKRIDTATDEGKQKMVARLDELHAIFAARVSEGRNVPVATVDSDFGNGGLLIAGKALDAGMIDDVAGAIGKSKRENTAAVGSIKTAATAEVNYEEIKRMTLEELKKDHSGVYAEAVKVGVDQGTKAERERRNAINEVAKSDPDNDKLQAICAEAVENGTDPNATAFTTKVNVAIRDGKKMSGENPPAVTTSAAGNDEDTGLSEDEQAQVDASVAKIKKIGG